MLRLFEVEFLDDALDFLAKVDRKTAQKIIYNIDKASYTHDPELFKKLSDDIWEFRTRFSNKQYRLLAFWDKRNDKNTLVICTHGFLKKTGKVPEKEINRAKQLRRDYLI